jgi:hypothetical protein
MVTTNCPGMIEGRKWRAAREQQYRHVVRTLPITFRKAICTFVLLDVSASDAKPCLALTSVEYVWDVEALG